VRASSKRSFQPFEAVVPPDAQEAGNRLVKRGSGKVEPGSRT